MKNDITVTECNYVFLNKLKKIGRYVNLACVSKTNGANKSDSSVTFDFFLDIWSHF